MKTANIKKLIDYADVCGQIDEKIITEARHELEMLLHIIKWQSKQMESFLHKNKQLLKDNNLLAKGKYKEPEFK